MIITTSFYLGIAAATITACSRNLPKPEPCIKAAAEAVRPLLAVGNLGDGFVTPPLEPLVLDEVRMTQGKEFMAVFTNVLVNGPSNFKVESLK